jgi:hypothetical protein
MSCFFILYFIFSLSVSLSNDRYSRRERETVAELVGGRPSKAWQTYTDVAFDVTCGCIEAHRCWDTHASCIRYEPTSKIYTGFLSTPASSSSTSSSITFRYLVGGR